MFVRHLFVLAVAAPSVLAAQRNAGQVPAYQHPVLRTDSIDVTAVSASPNGKWIAFDGVVRGHSSIWVVPSTGGEVRRLTDGSHNDRQPAWFPTGDRIAFATDRVNGLMTIGFDNTNGRAIGSLKRISTEIADFFDVAPDGKRIAYVVRPDARGKYRVRVAPSSGGAATTAFESADRLMYLNFDTDGKSVYVTLGPGVAVPDPGVLKIALEPNGSVAKSSPLRFPPSTLMLPAFNRVVTHVRNQLVILSLTGDTIAVMPRTPSPIFRSFSPDGQTMYHATSQIDARIQVVNTGTGAVSIVSPPDATGYLYPVGWTTDNRVAFGGHGLDTLFFASVGGTPRPVRTDPSNRLEGWGSATVAATGLSGDGRFLFVRGPYARGPYLFQFDLQTRRTVEITHQAIAGGVRTSDWAQVPEVHFFEKSEHGVDVKAVRSGEAPRTIAVLPSDAAGTIVSRVGNKILYRKQVGDSTIFYSVAGSETPKRFASVPGSVDAPVASPDGRWLAATASTGSGSGATHVVFLHVGNEGSSDRPAQFVATDVMWDLAWTPDSRAVFGLEEVGQSANTRIRRVPVNPSEPSTVIGPTNSTFWDTFLSSDGKYVAIPVEHFRGSTIWAYDLTSARALRP